LICLAPRARGDSVRPRRLSGVVTRPLNFCVRLRKMSVRPSIPALLVATLPLTAPAADSPAAWETKNVSIVETVPGQKGSADTRLEVGLNGDARITVDIQDNSNHTKGTILLIAGRWMLTQGFTPEPGEEIDVLDAAVLDSQLVMALLKAADPNGPPPPGSPQHVLFTEKTKAIQVATSSASGDYGAPWSVEGIVSVSTAAAAAMYRLAFTFSNEGRPTTLNLTGSVDRSNVPLTLTDSMPLSGWAIYWVGPYKEQLPDGTKFDYGAKPKSPKASTIGELRKLN
jgi:hypothetical protein